jgi:hypothetical protein
MTEVAFTFDDLDDHQDLKRRGSHPSFWHHKRLRRPARVAIGSVQDKPMVSAFLKSLRDSINADPTIISGSNEETDLMAVALPPQEVLRSIGASACQVPETD